MYIAWGLSASHSVWHKDFNDAPGAAALTFHKRKTDKKFLSIWVDCSILEPLFCNCIAYYALVHLFDVIYIHTRATTPALWRMDASPEKFEKKSLSFKTSSSFQGLFFLTEKYILCRLKAPTKVCSGESFETRCALNQVPFSIGRRAEVQRAAAHTPSFSLSV